LARLAFARRTEFVVEKSRKSPEITGYFRLVPSLADCPVFAVANGAWRIARAFGEPTDIQLMLMANSSQCSFRRFAPRARTQTYMEKEKLIFPLDSACEKLRALLFGGHQMCDRAWDAPVISYIDGLFDEV